MVTMPVLPEQLRKIMVVIVAVWAAFGLIVSETKAEMIMYSRTRGIPDASAIFSVETAGVQTTKWLSAPLVQC